MVLGPQFRFSLHPAKNGPAVIDVHDTSVPDDQNQNLVGYMEWDDDEIRDIDVRPQYQRQGVATEMWKRGQQAYRTAPFHFPEPKHSIWRTPEGDAWAKSTGDPLPPNEYR